MCVVWSTYWGCPRQSKRLRAEAASPVGVNGDWLFLPSSATSSSELKKRISPPGAVLCWLFISTVSKNRRREMMRVSVRERGRGVYVRSIKNHYPNYLNVTYTSYYGIYMILACKRRNKVITQNKSQVRVYIICIIPPTVPWRSTAQTT